jgi:Uma2 family endonuclease
MSIRDVNLVSSHRSEAKPAKDDELEYYYESHPTKEDLMGESLVHYSLIHYLVSVMEWCYRLKGWLITANLEIYQTPEHNEYPVAPDLAIYKDVVISEGTKTKIRSWKMLLPDRPPPVLVIEVSSKDTWKGDLILDQKPAKYGRLGVKEYFAYDPNDPRIWSETYQETRLLGWRYTDGQPVELQPNERGWLWSNELESWLVPDGVYLRLYDSQGQLRLTRADAEQLAREAAEQREAAERASREAERAAREAAERREIAERAAREAAEQREAAERAAREAAWAKLRELGIDPEKL